MTPAMLNPLDPTLPEGLNAGSAVSPGQFLNKPIVPEDKPHQTNQLKAAIHKAQALLANIEATECNGLAYANLKQQAESVERIIDIIDKICRLTGTLCDEATAVLVDYTDSSVKDVADWYGPNKVIFDGMDDIKASAWKVVDLFRSEREAAE